MKRLAVLGSTGSIGRQTLEVVRAFPDRFRVVALGCGGNLPLLAEQVSEFRAELVFARTAAGESVVPGVQYGTLDEIAAHPDVDVVVVATAGRAGLGPTLAAIRAGKTVALANKEVLVMAGEIVMAEARRHKAELLPVDSEHSAIWQCLRGEDKSAVSRLVLTASGGPFRLASGAELASVTPEQALSHPTWQMGTKVTVDSSTLMNKGMEVIEARWLFGVPFDRVDVVIHPQSIVHSIVEFVDGSSKAQLSMPDMKLPIQYALTYPERWEAPFRPVVDFAGVGALDFEAVDLERFPCLRLAREAGERGGTYPAVLSAADEVAVELFLAGRIRFTDIAPVVAGALEEHRAVAHPSLDDILAADAWARGAAGAGIAG